MPKNHQKTKAKAASGETAHVPVLLKEVLLCLDPRQGQSFLDATAGYGGHAAELLAHTKAPEKAVLVDRDGDAVAALKKRFLGRKVRIMHLDFLSAGRQLLEAPMRFDMILADLGTSSPHFDKGDRGFSVRKPGPLDMRMDSRQKLTAEQLLNSLSERELAHILSLYGEEPKARAIARLIVKSRPLSDTGQLADIVRQVWPGRSRIHPATRTFQALRIAVNDELTQLESSLPVWMELLKPGGRLALISFHSLEDRVIKRFFTENSDTYDAQMELLSKKPAVPSQDEIDFNPRARSAKLRAGRKK